MKSELLVELSNLIDDPLDSVLTAVAAAANELGAHGIGISEARARTVPGLNGRPLITKVTIICSSHEGNFSETEGP